MTGIDVLNTAVGLMSLVLGGFAIWLGLHFYEKAKESEKQTASALEAIRAQSDALQKLTGRWMDRFTRHATEPKPADEGLMALVSAMADLPTTILTTLRITPSTDPAQLEGVLNELVDSYIGLYYYTAITNVTAQVILPAPEDYDETSDYHRTVRRFVDVSATDFDHMARTLGNADEGRLAASRLSQFAHRGQRCLAALHPQRGCGIPIAPRA
ncbi:MAG: hypothetical protein ACREXY_03410 [Gammaproteobacteria bacterium]